MTIEAALQKIEEFRGVGLTARIGAIETQLVGCENPKIQEVIKLHHIDQDLLYAALTIKRASSQIDVLIHAIGILYTLGQLLDEGETVESASLGAGNTGKDFDLETNSRVAEFKFIDWQGGSESVRQNSLFKDFYELAEFPTSKRKYLYVVGTEHPCRFLNGRRALSSVLSRDPKKYLNAIREKYGVRIQTVRDYYLLKKDQVNVKDVSDLIGRTIRV